jgi:hypothetical protein
VATLAHLGLVWGAEQVVLPALNVSAPVERIVLAAHYRDVRVRLVQIIVQLAK